MKIKKILWLIVPVVVLFVAFMPRTAHGNNGAIIINGQGCGMLDGNGNGAFTDISHAVVTSNGNGVLTCRVTTTPYSGGGAAHWGPDNTGGAQCGTPAGITSDWHETVSASGQAELSCHVH